MRNKYHGGCIYPLRSSCCSIWLGSTRVKRFDKLILSFSCLSTQLNVTCFDIDKTETYWLSIQYDVYCGATVTTRSSADADNRLDAFSGQSRSTNMVPFHMLHIVSYCAVVTLSLRRAVFTIFVFKKFHDLEIGVKGHSRSLRVVSFDRLCMVSY